MAFKEARINEKYLNKLRGVCGFCGSKELNTKTQECTKCGTTNPNSRFTRRRSNNVSSKDSIGFSQSS